MAANIYDQNLDQNAANHVPLTPLTFLDRAAFVHPDKPAVIHGERVFSYREFQERCHRLASSLAKAGVGQGDTVAVLAGNVPATLEEIMAWCRDHMAHFKVPRTIMFGRLPKTAIGKIQKFVLREQAKSAVR